MVKSRLKNQNGETIVVTEESLAAATTASKGAVKQTDGVANTVSIAAIDRGEGRHYADEDIILKFDKLLKSLKQSGVVANNKFSLMYYANRLDTDYIPFDGEEYEAGDTATVKFGAYDEKEGWMAPEAYRATFLGWSTNKDAVTPEFVYDENNQQEYTVTFTDHDIELYGVWEVKTYGVTYEGGKYGTGDFPVDSNRYEEGDSVNVLFSPAPTFENPGYQGTFSFIGWKTGEADLEYWRADYRQDGNTVIDSIYGNITLYPVFAKLVSLTYALGDDATGTLPQNKMIHLGENVQIDYVNHPTCVSDPTAQFVGWRYETTNGDSDTLNASGNATLDLRYWLDGQSIDDLDSFGNYTLYPIFQKSITVTYSAGQYSDQSQDVPSAFIYNPQAPMMTPVSFTPHPERRGYIFAGWARTDGASVAEWALGGMPYIIGLTESITLYPVYRLARIIYNMGNYSDGGSVPGEQSGAPGDVITLDFSTHPTFNGTTFVGWSERSDEYGTATYTETGANTITLGSSDINLYPVYADQICMLEYACAQENDGNLPSTSYYVAGNTVNVDFSIMPHSYETDKTAVGWSTNYEDTVPVYQENGTTSFIINHDTTLYAIFPSESEE